MEHIEREPFIRPIWEEFDQLAGVEKVLRPERQDLGDAVGGKDTID